MTYNFEIQSLGECTINSPYALKKHIPENVNYFVNDTQKVLYPIDYKTTEEFSINKTQSMELAGPREEIYFDPATIRAGIVTCGGLCPGLNDVIRSIVMSLWYIYGVQTIYGIQNGLKGFLKEYNLPPIPLTPEEVKDIHTKGGTILGSSRGGRDKVEDIVQSIIDMQLNALFILGGDGTQRAAKSIAEEMAARGQKLAVIGIPKTIDNDLSFVEKSFGFETAVSEAAKSIAAAHVEATNAINGIGIVKVMGRESGFIAVSAAMAENDVNLVLIPEAPFDLEGENGLFKYLEDRLKRRGHAVVLVAEGAGQDLMEESRETDESGNKKLQDIGIFLSRKIKEYFKKSDLEINLKYIDPSYIIRATPANPNDSIYCYRLGNLAVHAAMAGKTNVLISRLNNRYVHIPIPLAVSKRNIVNIGGPLWRDLIEATGQPYLLKTTATIKPG